MALCEFHFFSALIGKQRTARVLLPDTGKPPFATFYLLHGQSDDETAWTRRTRIEEYVGGLPLIVVMPDGDRGFYTDNASGPAYARHFGEELPALIERFFPAKPTRAARCIGGLSMGGYGALRIALGYPERFCSANSHSGAVMIDKWHKPSKLFPEEFEQIFGPPPGRPSNDLLKLARRCHAAATLPKLLIDCGSDDFLIESNRTFNQALTRLHIPHEYREFPGVHNWEYWDLHVREAVAFHARNLKLLKR